MSMRSEISKIIAARKSIERERAMIARTTGYRAGYLQAFADWRPIIDEFQRMVIPAPVYNRLDLNQESTPTARGYVAGWKDANRGAPRKFQPA